MTFPKISQDLFDTCQKADGRNLAVVMLNVYQAIPEDMVDLRDQFCQKIGRWLDGTVAYTAPEVFPSDLVWGYAGALLHQLLSSYIDEPWAKRCRDIFVDVIKLDF